MYYLLIAIAKIDLFLSLISWCKKENYLFGQIEKKKIFDKTRIMFSSLRLIEKEKLIINSSSWYCTYLSVQLFAFIVLIKKKFMYIWMKNYYHASHKIIDFYWKKKLKQI